MGNLVLSTKCGNWVLGRCVKINRVTARVATRFVCFKTSTDSELE